MDLPWLSRNKATIVAVEDPTITKMKKGAAGPKFNKGHDHCFFFYVKGIALLEFVPPDTTVNSNFCCDI
jgi:hypothetical protein